MANMQLINLGSTQAPYWEYTKTLAANEHFKLNYVTDSFHLLDVSAPDALKVNFGGAMIQTPFTAGLGYKLTEPVEFIELWNDSATPLTVHFAVGIGDIQDNRLTVSGTVNTQIIGENGLKKLTGRTITSNASLELPYNANSEVSIIVLSGSVTVQNSSGNNDLYIRLDAGCAWNAKFLNSGVLFLEGAGVYSYTLSEY